MNHYECTFIVRHDMSPNDVTKLTATFADIIAQGGGSVTKNESWGLRSLAYPINKSTKGHYVMLGIQAPYDALSEMERQLRLSEDVIRYLTVKVEKVDNRPSVMLRQKNGEQDEAA